MAYSPNPQVQNLAKGLINLASNFESSEPTQATALKKEFKAQSKNDLSRTVVYLMEVVGVSDLRLKELQKDNNDLRELLKLNNISLEDENETQKADGAGTDTDGGSAVVGGDTASQTTQTGTESGAVSQEA